MTSFKAHFQNEIFPALKDLRQQLVPVLKSSSSIVAPALLLVFIPLQVFILQSQQEATQAATEVDLSVYTLAALNFIKYGLFIFIFSVRIAEQIQSALPTKLWAFFRARWIDLLRENLRSFARILIGVLLLILPGLFLAIRYALVSLVVLFDPRHQRGELDALKESWELTRGWMMLTIGLLMTLGVGLDFTWEALNAWLKQRMSGTDSLVLYSLLVMIELGKLIILLVSQIFLISLFRSRRGRGQPLSLELSVPSQQIHLKEL